MLTVTPVSWQVPARPRQWIAKPFLRSRSHEKSSFTLSDTTIPHTTKKPLVGSTRGIFERAGKYHSDSFININKFL